MVLRIGQVVVRVWLGGRVSVRRWRGPTASVTVRVDGCGGIGAVQAGAEAACVVIVIVGMPHKVQARPDQRRQNVQTRRDQGPASSSGQLGQDWFAFTTCRPSHRRKCPCCTALWGSLRGPIAPNRVQRPGHLGRDESVQ
jgi:hypothetical protein